jgi:hypothetical protein
MARGAAAQQQKLNSKGDQLGGQAQQIMGSELPVIQSQLQNPGYDPTTAAAIRRSGLDTVNTAFDASKFSAAQRAGSTGNDAMYYASADKTAQDRAGALSTAATNAEMDIGKQKLASQQQAIADASQLYGYNTNAMGLMYDQAGKMITAQPSVMDNIQQGVNIAKTGLGAAAGPIKAATGVNIASTS